MSEINDIESELSQLQNKIKSNNDRAIELQLRQAEILAEQSVVQAKAVREAASSAVAKMLRGEGIDELLRSVVLDRLKDIRRKERELYRDSIKADISQVPHVKRKAAVEKLLGDCLVTLIGEDVAEEDKSPVRAGSIPALQSRSSD